MNSTPVNIGSAPQLEPFDGPAVVAELNKYLRLRTTPIGMKLFESASEMEAVPKIRRPKSVHTTDQIVGQASEARLDGRDHDGRSRRGAVWRSYWFVAAG